jgi:uncharacterized Zn finger protein (UPF0148 family)
MMKVGLVLKRRHDKKYQEKRRKFNREYNIKNREKINKRLKKGRLEFAKFFDIHCVRCGKLLMNSKKLKRHICLGCLRRFVLPRIRKENRIRKIMKIKMGCK